jgi:alpha-amylase
LSKFKLAIALHNHQPVGNFDFVFDDAHQKAYSPMLELFSNYPSLKFSLHQSGILWEWQKKHYPNYLKLVTKMVSNNQVELLTGGYFEPILISIPERDVIGQVQLLNEFLKDNFSCHPKGGWLTERIWEPHLPKILNQSGIEYVAVDDTHFIYSGFESSQLNGSFITEHENYSVTLLPISKRLRYLIPFGKVEDIISELKNMSESAPNGLAVYADDGEKFGSWPNTYKHCYEDGWLQEFCDALVENSDWLEVISLGEAAKLKPIGRAYLPSASYSEMLHWSLPPKPFYEYEQFEKMFDENKIDDNYKKFVRGGHWRGFLAKYEEVNLMHKKMTYVSDKINNLDEKYYTTPSYKQAVKNLYAAQCNCPYWHGVFGGLYLPHIRKAIYSHLIKAENQADILIGEQSNINVVDYDLDGSDEVIIGNDKISAIFKPNSGGTMIEFSSKESELNLTDTLSRYKEGYHYKLDKINSTDKEIKSIHEQMITKEEGLDNLLVEDWYLKRCFIDHIITNDTELNIFKTNQYNELGDFIKEEFDLKIEKENNSIELTRQGNIRNQNEVIPCIISKKFTFQKESSILDIQYQIMTTTDREVEVNLGIENNFNLQAGHVDDRYILVDGYRHENSYLDSEGDYHQINSYDMVDEYQKIQISFNSEKECRLWHHPIFTVSLSESGFEKVFQGTTFVSLFKLSLSNNPLVLNFALELKSTWSKTV